MGGTFDSVLMSFGLDLVRSLSVGMVRVGRVGTRTLLGPEGPGADRGGFRILVVGGCSSRARPGATDCGVGVGTARTLRTTQWTRASST